MCRKSKSCILLGDEPSAWDKSIPLPPPAWFDEQAFLFRDAAEKAANGERDEAVQILRRIRSDEMRVWFDEHGQMSGLHRIRRLGVSAPKVSPDTFDVLRSPARYEKLVFERDFYKCRYCGLRLIAKGVLTAFEKAVGISEFCTQGTNADQHGVIHAFKIVADHVVPYGSGGQTNPDNLVSSCPACNYGKYNYTLEQLGIDDPRDRPPVHCDWDGLTSLIDGLKRNQLDFQK
jgi:5-methylcytosine-specific restriction endonuclease McrA